MKDTSNAQQMKKSKRVPIRIKWLLLMCTTVFIAIIVAVSIMGYQVSGIFKKDSAILNESTVQNATSQMTMHLEVYQNSIEQLSELVEAHVDHGDSMKAIEKTIASFQQKNDTLISAYFMDFKDGSLHASPKVEFDGDTRETETYKRLTEKPETKWMDVYKDIVSGSIMTSVVTPVMVDGKMVGALGYDIDLSTIGEIRANIEKHSDTHLIILDSQGFVVSSFTKGMDSKNLNPDQSGSVEGVDDFVKDSSAFEAQYNWVSKLYKAKNTDSPVTLKLQDETYTGKTKTVPIADWKVLAFSDDDVLASKIRGISRNVLISGIIGLVIGAICALFLAGRLVKIISSFQRVIEKTADGDLVTEFTYKSNDEIGDLADSYNQMLAKLRRLVSKVNGNAKSVTEANDGLHVIAAENSAAISEVSRSIDEIATGASNQAEHVEAGAATIQVLSTEIDGLSEKSRNTQSVLELATEKIEMGKEQVSEFERSYQKLESAFAAVTKMSERLVEQSQTISDVTDTISQISEQTNLLSLNASIEAARAGESGKGFAVVANEVRSLADDSKEATKNIQDIIRQIIADTEELVRTTNETNQISRDQKQSVQTVSDAMKDLEASIKKISSSITAETHSIGTINQQKETVVRMIEGVTAVSQQTSASSEEIASSMEEQAASSNELAKYTDRLTELIKELDDTLKEFHIE